MTTDDFDDDDDTGPTLPELAAVLVITMALVWGGLTLLVG